MTNLTSRIRTGNIFFDTFIGLIIAAIISKILMTSKNESSNLWNKIIIRLKSLFGFQTYTVTIRHDVGKESNFSDEGQNLSYHLIADYIALFHRDKVGHIHRLWTNAEAEDRSTRYREYKTAKFLTILPENIIYIPYRGHTLKLEFAMKEETIVNEYPKRNATATSKTIQISSNVSQTFIFEWLDEIWSSETERNFKHLDVRSLHYYVLGRTKNTYAFRDYDFSSRRTFDTLFFDQKTSFLSYVNSFLTKTGYFSSEAVPYRMNILMTGPPGSGKTSIIKSLANLTRRSIFVINPNLVKTNQELLDIFHSVHAQLIDMWDKDNPSGISRTIPLNKRIYVLEDIDCLSDIVKSRDESVAQSLDPLHQALVQIASKNEEKEFTFEKKPDDPLNLSGLLNVFDGILELTGSIVILTTNHPEKLDPALIRPGRINMKLHLGKMSQSNALKFIQLMYSDVTLENLNAVELTENKFTPAEIEMFLAASSSASDFLLRIQQA